MPLMAGLLENSIKVVFKASKFNKTQPPSDIRSTSLHVLDVLYLMECIVGYIKATA